MTRLLLLTRGARWPRELVLGFGYWLVFLLVLQPGNMWRAGGDVVWSQEAIRIAGAGLLGASVCPIILALTRRFPIGRDLNWRYGALHALANVGLAVVLILASCVLALLFLEKEHRPLLSAMGEELFVNGPLVFFSISGFTALAHAMRAAGRGEGAVPAAQAYVARVPVKSRGLTTFLDVADVLWIETQGNYLALHTSSGVHLIRETLARFEQRLDPRHFVRVHRRALVALDRVQAIETQGSGDGLIHLADGAELRVSRRFRDALKTRLDARYPTP